MMHLIVNLLQLARPLAGAATEFLERAQLAEHSPPAGSVRNWLTTFAATARIVRVAIHPQRVRIDTATGTIGCPAG